MATTEAAHEAASKGMPQLEFGTWPNQIFWLLVALVIIWLVLTRIALPRIAAILAERRGTIGGDLAAAEELKAKAKAAEAAYLKALEEARAEAGKIVAATKAEIEKDLAAATAKADAEIAAKTAESEKRIGEIKAGAVAAVADVARDTTGALLGAFGAEANASAIESAIAARLKG